MTNKFCRSLSHRIFFTNLSTSNIVKYKPCCFFTKDFEVNNKEQFNLARKITSSINGWTPFCQKCKDFERVNVKSPRHDSNEEACDGDGMALEIQMDKTCNAACITCGEWSSTTWSKYNNSINKISTQFIIKPEVKPNVDKILNIIDFESMPLRSILFLGGEPFVNDSHLKILDSVPTYKSPDIELSYTTNGSYDLDDRTLETFSRFKEIDISYSLDGIEDVFEYHRWPLKWDQVEKNFTKLLSYDDSKRISLSIGCTLTSLNVFYFDRLEQWANNLSTKFNKPISLDVNPAYGVMSLAAVSPKFREVLSSKYSHHPKLLGCVASQPYTDYAKRELIKHVDFHDQHRKLSWRETFSDVKGYFE